MKIAVASNNGKDISPHFGKSQYFLVFETNDGKIMNSEKRENTFTGHARGQCGQHGHTHNEQHKHGQQQGHSHTRIINALSDCNVVLCYGMGQGAAHDLSANNIQPFIVGEKMTAQDAVEAFLAGNLPYTQKFCQGHHHH